MRNNNIEGCYNLTRMFEELVCLGHLDVEERAGSCSHYRILRALDLASARSAREIKESFKIK